MHIENIAATPFSRVVPPSANGGRIAAYRIAKAPERSLSQAVAAVHNALNEKIGDADYAFQGKDDLFVLLVNFGFGIRPKNSLAREYGAANGLTLAPLVTFLRFGEWELDVNTELNVHHMHVLAMNFSAEEGAGSTQYMLIFDADNNDLNVSGTLYDPNDPVEEHDDSTWYLYVRA